MRINRHSTRNHNIFVPLISQVQLLQREGATHSPAPAIVGMGRTGDSVGVGEADSGGGFGSAAGEKRFADLLDARLGEERHLKVGSLSSPSVLAAVWSGRQPQKATVKPLWRPQGAWELAF